MNKPIGVLGGGQLGRMLAQEAGRAGESLHVYTDKAQSVCGEVALSETAAPYNDEEALKRFAESVRAVSFEFENVPSESLAFLEKFVLVRPGAEVAKTAQNRLREKEFFRSQGLPTVQFAAVSNSDDLDKACKTVGFPCVLKTQSGGYDGKGQQKAGDRDQALAALSRFGGSPIIAEAWAPFERELSVIIARGSDGTISTMGPFWNVHRSHILHQTVWPAPVSEETRVEARKLAETAAAGLQLVGVLCVEMFCLKDGSLLLNEIAPRPHNSGHLTIEAFEVSQFGQQLRAVLDWPILPPAPRVPAAGMINLLGDLWGDGTPDFSKLLGLSGVYLHLYGKRDARPGRKMGHVTVTAASTDALQEKLQQIEGLLGVSG